MTENKYDYEKMHPVEVLLNAFVLSFNAGQGFWWGMAATGFLMSLAQATLGKERYIKFCQDYWVHSAVSVPIAIIGLATCVFMYVAARKYRVNLDKDLGLDSTE